MPAVEPGLISAEAAPNPNPCPVAPVLPLVAVPLELVVPLVEVVELGWPAGRGLGLGLPLGPAAEELELAVLAVAEPVVSVLAVEPTLGVGLGLSWCRPR